MTLVLRALRGPRREASMDRGSIRFDILPQALSILRDWEHRTDPMNAAENLGSLKIGKKMSLHFAPLVGDRVQVTLMVEGKQRGSIIVAKKDFARRIIKPLLGR